MEIHVLYGLFVAEAGTWASAPLGRLPGGRLRIASQVPKRGSARDAPPTVSERVDTPESLEAVA